MAAGWERNVLPHWPSHMTTNRRPMREEKLREWMETVGYFEDTPGRSVKRSPAQLGRGTASFRLSAAFCVAASGRRTLWQEPDLPAVSRRRAGGAQTQLTPSGCRDTGADRASRPRTDLWRASTAVYATNCLTRRCSLGWTTLARSLLPGPKTTIPKGPIHRSAIERQQPTQGC